MNSTFCLLLTAGLLAVASPGHAQNLPDLAASPSAVASPTPEASATPGVSPTTPINPTAAVSPAQAISAPPTVFEPLPTLDANVILQPQYLTGPNFTVRSAVPTYSGSNHYIMIPALAYLKPTGMKC